jgi:hypothetical protein
LDIKNFNYGLHVCVSAPVSILKDYNMKKPILSFCLIAIASILFGQNTSECNLSGTVVDYNGEVLIGATISILGKNKGTFTDLNGNFKITVAHDDLLRISYAGFQSIERYPDEIEYDLNGRIELNEGLLLREVVIRAKKIVGDGGCKLYAQYTRTGGCGNKRLSFELSTNHPMQYYPNPTTDVVMVSTEETRGFINVFSSDGKLLLRQRVQEVQTRLDLLGLAAGVYVLSYENDDWGQVIGKVSLLRN